ncbi:related to triacylglycerol lipase V precursor [Fusarium mangiferae]|uniref:Related to triacylglycerol lipase V n=1 Tax=Fusarium mangiferae TaxID=192010 RepID=A0A1L7TLU7_FUSMA|nr:uncharacterized protein FMAN_10956 [Fusarium mangiferae]CVK96625.1 related to triacylglycerol lipase V precursor [Fusarium mangiferae]
MSEATIQYANFDHRTIGTIRGIKTNDVVQFLGIKYASLRHWFDNPALCSYDGTGIVCDRLGQQTISLPEAVDHELDAIQKRIEKPEYPGISGTECLNLNVVVPAGARSSNGIPVLVYIHGGGFSVGANWWPQFDMKRIVQLSVHLGTPIIGFMTSEELRMAGYKPNRGLHDQIVALQWVQKYIAGFGGDPSQVTVAGESVGGPVRLMYTEKALASRIVVMGGSPPSVPPLTYEVTEIAYKSIIEAWSLDKLSTTERLESLENSSTWAQHSQIRGLPLLPVFDNDLVPYRESFELIASGDYTFKAKQFEGAMIVYSPLDASIFAFMGLFSHRKSVADEFATHLRTKFGKDNDTAEQLLKLYGISPDLENQDVLLRVLEFGSDIGNEAAARVLAKRLPGDVFLMQFSEPNPWDGPFKGRSTHILDVAFLFQNFNDHLNETQQASAVRFATDVITFACGKKPWEPLSTVQGTSILKDGRQQSVKGDRAFSERYRELVKIAALIDMDSLLNAWTSFVFAA